MYSWFDTPDRRDVTALRTRLSQLRVELQPQPRPGHLNYLIYAQLPDTGWIRFDGIFSAEGRIVLRHLKQQERA